MLAHVRNRIAAACQRAGRSVDQVRLVAVTKGFEPDVIRSRVVDQGHLILGESRVQEWRDKASAFEELPVEWHLIGRLQRNKVKYCRPFALIHSIDSLKLAQEVERQGERMEHHFQVLIQVNVSGEDTKAGVALEELEPLLDELAGSKWLTVRGLMTMAPHFDDPELTRPSFSALREARDKLGLVELSMGMSNDFEVAIEEGATLVRVGSALFEGVAR